MAIFKEILRNDGSGITRFYRIDNGSITTLDYDALMNKPRINGKELIGDILIDISDFDLSNYYTKKETNTTIQAQLADYYTKKETDNQITKRIAEVSAPEVDLTDYYTKAETEVLVEEKIGEIVAPDINLTNYYTKAETDNKIEEALESIEIPEVEIDPNVWVVDGYNTVEEDPTSSAPIHYTVEPFGSGYGFEFREDGAYHALNTGINNSYAMCKIVFENIGGPTGHFILNFTQKSDYENDYGIISNTDEELIDDLESEEHAQIVLNQGGQIQQPEMTLASYADTTHFIVVKYKKDGEDSYDGEEFSFKVGENGMAVPHLLKNKKLVDEDKLNISYYDKEETEAKIDEKLANFEAPSADLSNYYDKTQTEAKIDEKIAAIPVNDLLHFKGHVNTADDLPRGGQVSGEIVEPNYVMNTSYMDSTVDNPLTNITLKNWVATYLRSNVYAYVGSDFDDVIDGVCFGKNPYGYGFPFIRVNASSTKPATVYNCKSIWYDDGTSEDAASKLISIFKPAWVANTYSVSGAHVMYGKMNYDLKLKYWDISQATIGSDTVTNINNKSITIGDFVYNLGYKIMRFDPSTQRLSWVKTTESDIIENHVYTVGENNDLVRANEADQKWEKIGGASTYSKEEIDNMIGDINTVLTEIVEGGE